MQLQRRSVAIFPVYTRAMTSQFNFFVGTGGADQTTPYLPEGFHYQQELIGTVLLRRSRLTAILLLMPPSLN
jgi:hypothetical protein